MRCWRFGLLLLLLAWCVTAWAEVPVTTQPRKLGVIDGLPSANINAFAEDHLGYLWLASDDGLARYDGRSFRIWRAEDGLRDNQIWGLHVDADNRLWIGTESAGLAVLSADRRNFHFFDRKSHPQMGSDSVWSIASTPDGSIWFGTATAGLHRLAADGSIQRFMPEAGVHDSLPSALVGHLAVTPDGVLWAGTTEGLARWTGSGFRREGEDVLPLPRVNGLTVDDTGNLWIKTNAGVVVRRLDGRFERATWPGSEQVGVLGMLWHSSDGTYWLDTWQGLGRSRGGEPVRNVTLYSAHERGVLKPNWASAHEDRDGGMWFASVDAGLWYLPPSWRKFSVLTRQLDDPTTLRNPYALALAASASGGIWVAGTRGALDRLDPATGAVEHHLQPIEGRNWPQSLAEDAQGRVWIGMPNVLVRYDPRDANVRRWHRQDAVDAMMEGDGDIIRICDGGDVWVYSVDGGMQRRDAEGRVLLYIAPGERGIPSAMLGDMQCGPDDRLWISGAAGIAQWRPQVGGFVPIAGGQHGPVHAFVATVKGVWASSFGRMDHYRRDGERLVLEYSIGAAEGFPPVALGGLVVDADGIVWGSNARGLIRMDPSSRSVRLYSVHDGLPGHEFRNRTLVQARGGQVAGGTTEGVVLFDPRMVVSSGRQPPLVIERVSVHRGDHELELTWQHPLELDGEDRDLRILVRLLSFADSANSTYRFRLDGYDPDWVDVGTSGERTFSRLPAGNYRLQVQAATSDKVWSQVKSLSFRVRPPWWQSAWAITAYVVLALGLVIAALLSYRARLRRRSEWQLAVQRRQLAEDASLAKTRFLATLGHEVRTPMTGVLGMTELLLDTPLDDTQRRYADSIQQAGTHLLHLVNDTLDLARIEAGRLELETRAFELNPFLDGIAGLLAPVAEKRGLRFVRERVPPMPVVVTGDETRLRQILMNLLNNAIKFTDRGQVGLDAELLPEGRGLRLVVSDTGPGITAEQQIRLFQRFEQADGPRTASRYGGSGLGLAICQELAVAMGGHIRIDSRLGAGARFTVELPLPWQPQAVPAEAPAMPVAEGKRALRILLVEDDPTVAEVVSRLLHARGHDVVHALHGLAALSEASTQPFDLGLLDLDLPLLDGLAIARQLRSLGFAFPLIAVTARSDADAEQQTQAAGFDGFLRKPVTGQMLADAIAAVRAGAATAD